MTTPIATAAPEGFPAHAASDADPPGPPRADPAEAFLASARAVAALAAGQGFAGFAGDELLHALDVIVAHRRHVDAFAAWAAGEIARRSRVPFGHSGLAQKAGFRSAEALIRARLQTTLAEAGKFVALGTILIDTAAATAGIKAVANLEVIGVGDGPEESDTALIDAGLADPGEGAFPWEAPIADALVAGSVSAGGGEAIRRGLGDTDDTIDGGMLAAASQQLLAESAGMSADHLYRRARQLRDEMDQNGIADRERHRYAARRMTYWVRRDGMYQINGALDPESGRIVFSALDAVLSPRRGGPRFVSAAKKSRARAIVDDPRSTEQLCADAFVEMVRIAGAVDPGTIFGSRRPAVRVIVSEHSLAARPTLPTTDGPAGHGYIEGVADPVSMETVERFLCDTGTLGILFDVGGQCVDVGRDQRTFTERQRTGLAARDGGCMIGDCDRPPAWCEAHHIDEWDRDFGLTNIADGTNRKSHPE
ncbi:DUF222 domain-containing protein [Lacisediminihabitans sp.]|jgi:hypothetical protein|uniref:DUF222 domain-containing protein n=1 Tax=Lacisediminihabitans sp. TaxID=2787631 RepID=UPI002F95C780